MSQNYEITKLLQCFCSQKQKIVSRVNQSTVAILLMLLLSSQVANAQLSGTFTFEDSMQGWTTAGYGEFAQTTVFTCGAGNSTRANVYFNGINHLVSPSLGISNGTLVTMSFDYKVLEYDDLTAASEEEVEIKVQWSNSASGPWTNFFGINLVSHNPSSSCTTKTKTFTPTAGPLFVRFQNKAVGTNTDLYYYYDNIIFSQGAVVSCAPASSILVNTASITSNSFSFDWVAPIIAPTEGYEYEVRTSGIAGSGANGLVTSGAVQQGITTAMINGLLPNTTYTVFVRSKCSDTNFSSWSSSIPLATLCVAENIPYIMPLNTAVVPALPNCVTMENVNTDDRFWITAASTVGITGKVLQYTYNYAMPAEDWFFTPMLNLTASTSYRIAFKYKVSAYQEKLKVAVGAAPASEAMTTTLLDLTIPSTTSGASQQFIDFTVPNDGAYSIGFEVHSNLNSNILYIGEVSVNLGPTCIPPREPFLSEINKTSATISWTAATILPADGYVYEVRTSGSAGSGTEGLVATGSTSTGITTVTLENLENETDYRIYIASSCGDQDRSTWTPPLRFKTLCDYTELQAVNTTICQGLTALLEVSSDGATIDWFETETSEEIIYTGTSYNTPPLQETTAYYTNSRIIEADQIVKIGNGDQIAQAYQNPFFSIWSNNHTQHIIPATELRDQGMTAGPLNSVGLTVTNIGSLPMIGLSVKIGSTTIPQLADFIDNSAFATVFTAVSYMPVLGTNVFEFTTPFEWDGLSNIVLEFCHGNPDAFQTMNRGVLADDTEYISSIKANFFIATDASVVCANTTDNINTFNIRPVFIFSGTIICQAPRRTEVVATVNQVQPIEASSVQILNVSVIEDATLANLEPNGIDILWFATETDALELLNQLLIDTQLQSGYTYYAVRAQNNCYSAPFAVLVTVALGVEKQDFTNLVVYPNPVKEQLTLSNTDEISALKFFNIIGQEVLSLSPHSSIVVVDMTSLSTGIYLIQVNTEIGSKIVKVHKE